MSPCSLLNMHVSALPWRLCHTVLLERALPKQCQVPATSDCGVPSFCSSRPCLVLPPVEQGITLPLKSQTTWSSWSHAVRSSSTSLHNALRDATAGSRLQLEHQSTEVSCFPLQRWWRFLWHGGGARAKTASHSSRRPACLLCRPRPRRSPRRSCAAAPSRPAPR